MIESPVRSAFESSEPFLREEALSNLPPRRKWRESRPRSKGRAVPLEDRYRPREVRESMQEKRSEEHTSELQSPCNLVCRLLLEKKKQETRRRRVLGRG